ncbi:MAG TPA: serine hydrolase [Vicinamibacterales bacterium]|jgi:beta-lactamase class A|nr:serine hydrolase [Vicinamibacterales bacterium]
MKGSRLTAQAAFLLLAATASASAQMSPPAELRAKFEKRVQEISSRVDGVVGYSIVDLTSGERIGHLESASFPTASAIKLAIVYELFKQADEKRIDLEEKVTLDRRQAVGGTGVLVEMGTPTLSIRDYAVLMVTLSDNTATNVLIDRLGMDRIAARMQGLGLNGTKLRRHMMDTAAARRGDENVSTPDELVRLLEAMHGPMTGPARTGHYLMGEAIDLLKKPKENRLRKGLPEGVASADKSGELEGVRVDAGIVFAKNRPYVLCVMTTFLKDEAEGERAIEEISRVAYEYFSRLGAGGTLGRLNGK